MHIHIARVPQVSLNVMLRPVQPQWLDINLDFARQRALV